MPVPSSANNPDAAVIYQLFYTEYEVSLNKVATFRHTLFGCDRMKTLQCQICTPSGSLL